HAEAWAPGVCPYRIGDESLRDRSPGSRPPFGPTVAQAMSAAISPVSGKPYGLAAVCRVWRLARSGIYRRQAAPPATPPQRRGPLGAMSDDALTWSRTDCRPAHKPWPGAFSHSVRHRWRSLGA